MEIDDILEEDLLDVFNDVAVKKTVSAKNIDTKKEDKVSHSVVVDDFEKLYSEQPIQKKTAKTLEINSENIDNVTVLLKELLNNKTIEITIKIKEN